MPAIAFESSHISHGGFVMSGSPNVFANGLPVARLGDLVYCEIHSFEGNPQVITSGSPNVFANGLPVARIGDSVSCGAVIVTGSPNVFCNG